MNDNRKYQFSWDLLGDIQLGRPNLGQYTRLENYRLMQYCFRDILEQQLGTERADELFYAAGHLAGSAFYKHKLAGQEIADLGDFVRQLQRVLQEDAIGILRLEKADVEAGTFVLTVSEDLDCSGLPELDYEVCVYDEGFIAGILESYTGQPFQVEEVDCWCTGDRTCRFVAEMRA